MSVIRCAVEVNRHDWYEYRNDVWGFSIWHPPSYSVSAKDDTLILAPIAPDVSGEPIVLRRMRHALTPALVSGMDPASWKIADRHTYALISPYIATDDGQSFTAEYLFIRDFPFQAEHTTYAIITASITEPKKGPLQDFLRASIADIQGPLTPNEQILSTFRFLQYGELYN